MVKISKQDFGELIRKLRTERENPLTLRKFAEKVDISPTYLSKIERGDFDPPAEETIRRIASELGYDEDKLLAMAGKISSDLNDIITRNPVEMASFLRTSKGLSKEKLEQLIAKAEKLKKGD
jgi:transcriptional regulator with XRE-family HTH domain